MPKYPDTGETGETYDLEFEETTPDAANKEAIENAAEFLRKQGKQSPSMDKLNR